MGKNKTASKEEDQKRPSSLPPPLDSRIVEGIQDTLIPVGINTPRSIRSLRLSSKRDRLCAGDSRRKGKVGEVVW